MAARKIAPPVPIDRPPGYKPTALHIALVAAGWLDRIPPLALTPLWLALAAGAAWPWGSKAGAASSLALAAALLSLTLTLADGVSLALLPRRGRSFGPVTPPLLALTFVRAALTFGAGLLVATWPAFAGLAALQAAILAVAYYALWIEPFRLERTRAELRSPKLREGAPLRLLHLSDIHVERVTPREERVIDVARAESPDLILLTGDYVTLGAVHDADAQAAARATLAEICQAAPPHCRIYAVTGSPPVDHPDIIPAIFGGLSITWLTDETQEIAVNGQRIRLAGLRCTGKRAQDAPRLRALLNPHDDDTFTILLYHSPDLAPEAAEMGVDLYLCGHTHGGQIRAPLFGAIFTSSEFGKRYEAGRYREREMTLYVSRGLGMEGLGAPRARFLSPPEAIIWTLSADRVEPSGGSG